MNQSDIVLKRAFTRHDLDPKDDRWPSLMSKGSAVYTFRYTPDWAAKIQAHVRRHGFGRAGLKDRRASGGFMDESAIVVATRRTPGGPLMVSTVSVKSSVDFPPPPLESPDRFFERNAFNLGDAILCGVDNQPPRIPLDGAVVAVLMPGIETEVACVAPKTATKLNVYRELPNDEAGWVSRTTLLEPNAAISIGSSVRIVDEVLDDAHKRKPDVRKRKRSEAFTSRISVTRAIDAPLKPKRAAIKIESADTPPVLWESIAMADRLRVLTGMPWTNQVPKAAAAHIEALREAGRRDLVEGGFSTLWTDVVSVPVRTLLRGPDWLRRESGCAELFQMLSKATRPAGFESSLTAQFPSAVRPIQSFVVPRKQNGGLLVVDAGTINQSFIATLWSRFKQTARRRVVAASAWAESTTEGTRAFTAEERRLLRCAAGRDEPSAEAKLDLKELPPCVRSLLPGGAARKRADANDPTWNHMRNEERMVAAGVLGSTTPKQPIGDIEDLLGSCFSNIGTPADKAHFRYMYKRPMPKKMFSCGRLIGSAGFALCPYAKVYGSNGAFLKCTEGCDTSGLRRTPFGAAAARMRKNVKDE